MQTILYEKNHFQKLSISEKDCFAKPSYLSKWIEMMWASVSFAAWCLYSIFGAVDSRKQEYVRRRKMNMSDQAKLADVLFNFTVLPGGGFS